MDKPIIILLEGANSTGKGTVLQKLKKRLLENGLTYKEIFQPYFPENRKILLSGELSYRDEYDVFVKDRIAVHAIIKDIINNNDVDVLLLDRNIISSYVYQAIIHDDYEMSIRITKDASMLYKNLNIDIGVHLEAEPRIIAERNKQSNKYDYRDSSDIEKIQKELWAYCIGWSTFLSLGNVGTYLPFQNNTLGNMTNIINEIDNRIIEILKKE